MVPIVFQALPKWDSAYNSTALTISKLLSENRKVFYIEHPFSVIDQAKPSLKDRISRRNKHNWEMPFTDHPNFIVINPLYTLPINALKEGSLYRFLLKQYISKLWKRVDSVLSEFKIKEFGYINSFDPVYFEFESKVSCTFKIYHSVDLISGEPYIARHGIKAEQNASKAADFVLTTSFPLKDRLKVFNPNTECIPNAADFDHFSKDYPKPFEFRNSTRKRIVYTGNIGLRIDYQLLERVAKAHPDLDFWIIGPKDENYFGGKELESISNVYFTGAKSYKDLPAYIHHADACIIPFKCTDLTYHIYPLKLNEYLSSGKPVLTSAFTDFGKFEELMYIYKSSDEAIEKLSNALQEPKNERIAKRIDLASENTWKNRMINWEQVIDQLEAQISSINQLFHRDN
ncbi:MAG: hypothetical protein BalsKO_13960 [Balneolaceae bacterium]